MAFKGVIYGPDVFGNGELLQRLYRVERKLDLLLEKLEVEFDEDAALCAAALPEVRVAVERGDKRLAIELQEKHTGISNSEAVMIVQALDRDE